MALVILTMLIISSCTHSVGSVFSKFNIGSKKSNALKTQKKHQIVASRKSLQEMISDKYSFYQKDYQQHNNDSNNTHSFAKQLPIANNKSQNTSQSTNNTGLNINNDPDALNQEDVIVKDGLVCVHEKSSNAQSLAYILNQEINSDDLAQSTPVESKSQIGSFNIIDHPSIDKWYSYFLDNRNTFQRYLNRGANFKHLVSHVLEQEQLPQELFFLALIESGFRPTAKSSASAVGIWQFIRGTGKRYGLNISYYVDERKDPVRATRAAARYLEALYRVYQNWELAAAAYNAGENRVLSAIMRGHTRDYWELSSRKLLPKETRNYVPKIMAAIKISREYEKHGFYFKANNNYGIPHAATVPGGVKLKNIAKVLTVSEASLKSLNPHLKHNMTPPGKDYKIWVSSDHQSKLLVSSYKSLHRLRHRYVKKSNSASEGYHLVRRGQNLQSISRRYGVSVAELKRLNGITGSLIYTGQKLKISSSNKSTNVHVVQKGDTLYSISKKYRVSIRDIKRKNRIKGSLVLIGQKIQL